MECGPQTISRQLAGRRPPCQFQGGGCLLYGGRPTAHIGKPKPRHWYSCWLLGSLRVGQVCRFRIRSADGNGSDCFSSDERACRTGGRRWQRCGKAQGICGAERYGRLVETWVETLSGAKSQCLENLPQVHPDRAVFGSQHHALFAKRHGLTQLSGNP